MRNLAVFAALVLAALWVLSGLSDSEELFWRMSRLASRVEPVKKADKE